jgi:hypothetical protein
MRAAMLAAFLGGLLWSGCAGDTGGQTLRFPVAAAGPADATPGAPLVFDSGGVTVTLTEARLHVGAVYLNQAAPASGAQATDCYLPGTYVAEETAALDVDLLDPTRQPFPQDALGVTQPPALAEQIWLTGGDVNAPDDPTPILQVAGTAEGPAGSVPFQATVTIGANHVPSGSVLGGGDSICRQRIVSPIQQPVTLRSPGGLLLRIDPRLLFVDVDFSQVPLDPATGVSTFTDDPRAPGYAPAAQNLYANLRSVGPYQFVWEDDL